MKPQDIKIRTRMVAGFAIVLGLMIVIMFVGMINMRNLHYNMDRIVKVNTQHIIASNQVGNSLREIGIALRSIFLSNNEEERKAMEVYIDKQSVIYNEGLNKVEELTNRDDPKALELIAKIKSAQEAAIPLRNTAIKLLSENRKEEALDYLNNETRPAVHKWITAVDELSDHQFERIKYRSGEAEKKYTRTNTLMLILGTVAIVLAVIIALCLTNSITRPLRETVALSNALANGDLTVHVESVSAAETGQVLAAIDLMARQLQKIIAELKTSADSIASASRFLSSGSEQMSKGVVQQSERASQIATSSAEMSQTVIDVARNASDIAVSATDTAAIAKEGAEIVSMSVRKVEEIANTVADSSQLITSLGQRSKQIGEIIVVIKDIADQTNLLALNAAIEAARAGEQGRGFAVVADEVRRLAERTAKATSEIAEMIGAMQNEVGQAVASMSEATGKVETGVRDVTRAGDSLHRIVKSVDNLQAMVQQVASATEEMSSVSGTVSSDVETVAMVTAETSAHSRKIAESAYDLARLATNLQNLVSRFKL